MKLTPKLLDLLNRVFDKDPKPFLALRVRYAGGLTWAVSEGVLTLTVTGGVGASVSYNLADYTLRALADAIAARAGFEVAFLDAERGALSALVLLDAAGDQDVSNGERLLGYTSLTWAIFEAYALPLQRLRDQVAQMLRQMSTTTGEGVWLDEIGSYYGVVRMVGEVDPLYGQRIIAETLRPISNNVAIERAIEDFTGQPCRVLDVTIYRGVFPLYDGAIDYDGSHDHSTPGAPEYGLFDIEVGYDLIGGGDITSFLDVVGGVVERLRSAGTHLRALALSSSSSPLGDDFPFAPDDSSSVWSVTAGAITEAFTAPTEATTTWSAQLGDMADSLTPPSETADGAILAILTDGAGNTITDGAGQPIYAPVSPLFV